MSIVKLIDELQKKPCWDVPLMLHFLREQYKPHFNAYQFTEHIMAQKPGTNRQAVLDAATLYTS